MNAVQSVLEDIAKEMLFEPNTITARNSFCQRIQERLTGHVIKVWDDEELDPPFQINEVICHDDTKQEQVNDGIVMLQIDLYFKDIDKGIPIRISIGPQRDGPGDLITIIRPDIGPPRE